MRIQIEEKEPCKIYATCVGDPDEIETVRQEVENEVCKKSKNLVLPGFRKGKAPRWAVLNRFKSSIEDQMTSKLLAKAEQDVLFEQNIKPMFNSSVQRANLHSNTFECELLVMKRPEVELKEYKGWDIPQPHILSIDEMTEKLIQELRMKYAEVLPFSDVDTVQLQDKITMDVVSRRGEESVPELSKPGMYYVVGEGFYPEFDTSILGMKVGEERTFLCAGEQPTEFTVKIHMGVKTVPAPLTDEFAIKLGYTNFDQLRADAVTAASQKTEEIKRTGIYNQLISRLIEKNSVTLPEWLVRLEMQDLAKNQNFKIEEVDEQTLGALEKGASQRLKISLIFNAIREKEPSLQMNNLEMLNLLRAKLEEQKVKNPQQMINELTRSGKIYGILAELNQAAVQSFLLKNCNIVE